MLHLVKNNTCPITIHKLSMVDRFVDDLFELDRFNFERLMYLHLMLVGSGIYPKASCHLNYTSILFFDN